MILELFELLVGRFRVPLSLRVRAELLCGGEAHRRTRATAAR